MPLTPVRVTLRVACRRSSHDDTRCSASRSASRADSGTVITANVFPSALNTSAL